MKRKTNTRVVLITNEQYANIEKLQQQEQEGSTTGAAPTVNAIIRALLDSALSTPQEK